VGEITYQTNLASEFFVLSALTRLGFNASLTLGNKKSVDIFVFHTNGNTITIDVKGISGKNDWILGDSPLSENANHFFILLTFDGKMDDISNVPRIWVIPAPKILSLIKTSANRKTKYVSRKTIREQAAEYENAWHLIEIEQ
jgi:hypothetical protein